MQTLGGFSLQTVVGKGGFATVYKAIHSMDDRPIAIKVLHNTDSEDQSLQADFFNEIQAAARLNHPNITTIYDFGTVEGDVDTPMQYWLAMELVEGGTIKDLKGRLNWEQLHHIIESVLNGLGHAHAQRMIHRDIKPRNILYDSTTYQIKISDFGLVQSFASEGEQGNPTQDLILGTPAYMSPEQILNDHLSFGPWTDLYALGCMVWELICGRPPFQGGHQAIFHQHLHASLPPFNPLITVPEYIEEWLGHMLARNPNERFQSSAQALYALNNQSVNTDWVEGDSSVAYGDDLDMPTEALTTIFDYQSTSPSTTAPLANVRSIQGVVAGFRQPKVRLDFPDSWRKTNQTRQSVIGVGLKLLRFRTLEVVGREQERDRLWDLCRKVSIENTSKVVLMQGVSGIGKKSLGRWLAYRADELGGAQWLEASFSVETDYRDVLLDTLNRHFRLYYSDSAKNRIRLAEIHRSLQMEHPEDISDLLQLVLDRESHTCSLWKTEIFNALFLRYLRALSKIKPVVMLFHGTHNALEVFQLVEMLLEEAEGFPILLVSSQDSVLETDSLVVQQTKGLLRHNAVESISLKPMNSVDLIQFVQSLLGLSLDLASIVEEKSGGNPQIAIQMVLDWIEAGVLLSTPQGFQLQEGYLATLPSSMLSLWNQRYNGLFQQWTTSELQTIEYGALLGVVVDEREWMLCLQNAKLEKCQPLMQQLQKNGWILQDRDSFGWTFSTGLFREAILEYLKKNGRLSEIAQKVLDTLPESGLSTHRRATLCIYAECPMAALTPLFESSKSMALGFEMGSASRIKRLRDDILNLVDIDPNGKHAFETALLDLFLATAEEQNTTLESQGSELIAWGKRLEDWPNTVQLYATFGRLYWHAGKVDLAKKHLLKALKYARRNRLPTEVSILHKLVFLSKDTNEAYQYCREALFRSEELGSMKNIGLSYNSLGIVQYRSGNMDASLFALHEAQLRFERSNYRPGLIDLYLRQGELYRRIRDFPEAERAYLRCLKLNQMTMRVSLNVLLCQVNLLIVYFELGRVTEVLNFAKQVWSVSHPVLHPSLPKIAANIAQLTQTLALAIREDWQGLNVCLSELRMQMDKIHFFDDDVYWLLSKTKVLCEEASQMDCVELIELVESEQRTRQFEGEGDS